MLATQLTDTVSADIVMLWLRETFVVGTVPLQNAEHSSHVVTSES